MSPLPRSRTRLALGLACVIALGLASRALPLFPSGLANYPGDALWALMVYLALAFVAPASPALRLAAAALAVSFGVEAFQLVRAPWIEAIRDTVPGRLALGSGFDPVDFLAYTVGIGLGGDLMWPRVRSRRSQGHSGA